MMSTSKLSAHPLFLACLAIAIAGMPGLRAEAAFHSDVVNATGACNGALPGFEGALRKRPTAIANEGASSAFVNCSLTTDRVLNDGYDAFEAYFTNQGSSAVAVSCTFVAGLSPDLAEFVGAFAPQFYPKVLGLAPGATGVLRWQDTEFEIPDFLPFANLSCSLPPDVEIATIGAAYEDGE